MRIWESSEGILCICFEKASGKVGAGIGAAIVGNGSDMVGDMAAEERGVVMVEEESIMITGSVGGKEARWTEMSTVGRDVVTITREASGAIVKAGRAKRGSNLFVPFTSSSWTKCCSVVPSVCLSLLEGEPLVSFLV